MTRDGKVYHSNKSGDRFLMAEPDPNDPGIQPYRLMIANSARLKIIDGADIERWVHPAYSEREHDSYWGGVDKRLPFIYNGEIFEWIKDKIIIGIDRKGNLIRSINTDIVKNNVRSSKYKILHPTMSSRRAEERVLILRNPFGHKLYNANGMCVWNVNDAFHTYHNVIDNKHHRAKAISDSRHPDMEDYRYYWDDISPFDPPKYMISNDKKDGDNWIYHEENKDVDKHRDDFLLALKTTIEKHCKDESTGPGHHVLDVESWNVDAWIDSDPSSSKDQLSTCFTKLMSDIEHLSQFYSVLNIWHKRECNIGYKFHDENWSVRI